MLALTPNTRPSPLPLPAALVVAELGPVVTADDPCEAALGGADPPGPRNYYRARYYDPKIGRFISEDPIPFVDGPNPYTYVGNDPVNFRDPLGLAKDSVTASLEAAIRNGNPGEIQAILDTAGEVLSPAARQAAQTALRRLGSKASDIISRECVGKINRVFPEQMREKTLEEIIRLARQGDKAAQTAKKLLTSGEYLK